MATEDSGAAFTCFTWQVSSNFDVTRIELHTLSGIALSGLLDRSKELFYPWWKLKFDDAGLGQDIIIPLVTPIEKDISRW